MIVHRQKSVSRIIYFSFSKIPSDTANAVQVMKTADALVSEGMTVVLFSALGDKKKDVAEFYATKNRIEIRPRFKMEIRLFGLLIRAFGLLIENKLSKNIQPNDVIYGRDIYALFLLDIFYDNPVFLELHMTGHNWLHRYMERRLIKNPANKVIVTSKQLKSFYLKQITDKYPDRVHVVPNGASDFSYILPMKDKADKFVAGYVGRVSLAKGAGLLISLAQERQDINFIFVGPIDLEAKYKKIISELDNVELVGLKSQNQLKEYYNSFDVVLAPYPASFFENGVEMFPSPLKISEYMSTGLPIIASQNQSTLELLDNNRTAILCENDVGQWSDAITLIQSNPQKAKMLGTAARGEYEQKYSWKARAQTLIGLFSKC